MKEKKKKEQKPSIERFDKLSGICEIEGRFYVFCDYVEDDIFNELGSVIGEGKTKEKALIGICSYEKIPRGVSNSLALLTDAQVVVLTASGIHP